MSATEIGILSGLLMIMIAAAAIPGSLAIAKFGALHTLVGALILAAIGAGLRGFIPDVAARRNIDDSDRSRSAILMRSGVSAIIPVSSRPAGQEK
jgi:hypothetical protein